MFLKRYLQQWEIFPVKAYDMELFLAGISDPFVFSKLYHRELPTFFGRTPVPLKQLNDKTASYFFPLRAEKL